MPLAETGRAIGAVTQLLHDRLLANLLAGIAEVSIGRPEPPVNNLNNPRLNLFLYEIHFDEHLKNVSLDEGQPAPLWLVLRYLLTAFDESGESDTAEAHEILGQGIRVLHDLNFFSPTQPGLAATIIEALEDNPDMLKLSFDEASSDLLAKLMQGSEERYRCSVSFQVRPVMIASGKPPVQSLLVGINYQTSTVIGEDGIQTAVIPSLGPVLTQLLPAKFGVGTNVTVLGTDLHLSGLSVMLGAAELPVVAQRTDRLAFTVSQTLARGTVLSAGSQPIAVIQTLPSGRRRTSNLLVGGLLPRLDTAVPSGVAPSPADATRVVGDIDMTGILLGMAADDVFVGLYRAGRVVRSFDTFVYPPGPITQTQMQLHITEVTAVLPGTYRVILRVNGQQALNSPEVVLVP